MGAVARVLKLLPFDRLNLDGLDFHPEFFEPLDCAFDFVALAMQRERDEADLIRHAGLPDIRDDFEFLPEFPNDWLRYEPRGEHEPEALFVVHCWKS